MDALPSERLPPGWTVAKLGDLGVWTGGGTPSKSRDDFWTGGTVPWVSPKDMKAARVGAEAERITEAAVAQSAAKLVPAGSVLCVVRSGILQHTFPVAIAEQDVTLNQDMRALTPARGVAAEYLRLYLRYRNDDILHSCSKDGTTVASIEQPRLHDFPVPLAPEAEQTRIVAVVNELFEEVEAGEAALARARDSLTQFRASLLHAAYSGELTADWRAVRAPNEAAADLVASIVAKRRAAGWTGAIPETSAVAPLPPGWVWSSLGELFDVFVGATPARSRPEFWGGDIPWVSSGEVAFCTIQRTRETITTAGLANSSTRLHPPGTVLLAMIGEGRTRGQAAILDVAACNNQNSAAVRVSDTPIPPRFVYHWLTFVYEETRRAGAGGNQPALNKERVRCIAIPVPPLTEMEEIVSRVDAQLSDSILPDLPEDSSRLRQSILHTAFSGRLVPQDAADEPATALLARLRATPAASRRPRARRAAAQPDLIENPA